MTGCWRCEGTRFEGAICDGCGSIADGRGGILFDCDDVDAAGYIDATGPLRGYIWFPITWASAWSHVVARVSDLCSPGFGWVNAPDPCFDRSGLMPVAHSFSRDTGSDLGLISGDIEGAL